jgi:diguanylate cyclase (GGDEF)-like protein
MAFGRSKSLADGEAVPLGASPLRGRLLGRRTENRELAALRCTNEQLMRELAVLKEREERAQRLAERDDLTGLYNRRRMVELLDWVLDAAAEQWQCVGVLFIDLNGFKSINDEYGHAAGDKILTTVGARIAARVRAGDVVGRFGGDEFVVVLPNTPTAGAVSRVADTIRERVALPYWFDGNELRLTAAIGESMYPRDGKSADALLHRADQEMYRLKTRALRPMLHLGGMPQPHLSRRRDDEAKSRGSGSRAGGDL